MKRKIFYSVRIIILSFIMSLSSSNICYAEVNIDELQGYLNGEVAQRQINQSNNPKYADRYDSVEEIDPITGNLEIKQTDIYLPGKDGLDLKIGRIYNSSQDECIKKVSLTSQPYYYYVDVTAYYVIVELNGYTNEIGPYSDINDAYNTCYYYLNNVANVVSATVNYGTRTIQQQGYNIITDNISDKYSYNKIRYNLGAGWAFSFPSVQIENYNGIRYLYYHDGSGNTYRIIGTSNSGSSNLEGYQGNDVKFIEDNGSYINGDNIVSKYKFVNSELMTTYFGEDGRLLGIKDRFNNEIKFRHQNYQIYQNTYPLISSIEDSVGRTVAFSYSGDNINLTITVPNESNQFNLTYKRNFLTKNIYHNGTLVETYQYPVLDYFTDPLGRNTYYENYYLYNNNSWPAEKFLFNLKDLTNAETMNRYLIGAIVYPGSKTLYEYEKVTRNLGADGATEAYRIKTRYDKIQRFNNNSQSYEWLGDYNKISYSYNGDYTGYPNYSNEDTLPDTYQFWSNANALNSISTKNVYNGSKQLIQVEYLAGNNEKKTVNNLEFNTTYKFLPTKIETSEYTGDGTLARTLYEGRTYTAWGGISSTTLPLTLQQYNDTNIKGNYTTSYFYENTTYPYYLTRKQSYQNNTRLLTDTYAYNSLGRISSYTNAKGETTSYTYTLDSGNNKTEDIVTKQLENGKTAVTKTVYGSETRYAYPKEIINYYSDNQGIYTSTKTSKTYYMLSGLVKTEADNENNTTAYTYDNDGRVISIQYPNYSSINGENYSVRQGYTYTDGYYQNYTEGIYSGIYGTIINSSKVYINTANNITSYYDQYCTVYDAYGNLRQETLYNGTTNVIKSKYTYDNQQRVISSIDAVGNTVQQSYNAWGEVKENIDPQGNLYVNDHDILSNKSVSYFVASGNVANYRSNTVSNTYKEDYVEVYLDQFGRAISRKVYSNWPNLSGELSELYSYDIAGNLTGYMDPKCNYNEDGYTASYTYDELNRIKEVKDALNQVTAAEYTLLGNVSSVKLMETAGSSNIVTLYSKTYNELGSILSKTDPSGNSTGYSYNSIGLNTRITDRKGSILSSAYDSQNRLKESTWINQGGQSSLGYKYYYNNPFGYTSEQLYTNGTLTSQNNYSYNAAGRVTQKNVQGSNYINSNLSLNYDDAGRLISLGAGVQGSNYFYSNYKYTGDRLTGVQTNGLQAASASDTENAVYEYYPDGKLKNIIYPKLANGLLLTTEYIYNALGRLTSMTNKMGSTTLSQFNYTYDANGNILSINDGTTTKSYIYDKLNRLTEIWPQSGGSTIYTYDLRGNRKTKKGETTQTFVNTTYSYNLENKLELVTKGTATTSMAYYADGLRAKKQTASGTTHYIYNQSGKLVAEAQGTSAVTANYVWGPDRALVKKVAGGGEYYYLYNGHGDVIQMVDRNGNVVNNYQYDEWGNITTSSETISNPFKYAGEVYDQETGMYYLRARYYDPSIGRFINEDTYEGQIDNPLTLNLYAYCGNNPLNYTDPSGHIWYNGRTWVSSFEGTGKTGEVFALATHDLIYLSDDQQKANAEYIFDDLSKKGWSTEAICGLLGNIEHESHFNPGQWQKGASNPGYGLVQWTPYKGYRKFLDVAVLTDKEADKMAQNDPKQIMDLQLNYLIWSCQPSTPGYNREWIRTDDYAIPDDLVNMTYEKYIKSTGDVGDLALVFHGSYERSGDDAKTRQKRVTYANEWYEYFSR